MPELYLKVDSAFLVIYRISVLNTPHRTIALCANLEGVTTEINNCFKI
jgi:hypothetical protein